VVIKFPAQPNVNSTFFCFVDRWEFASAAGSALAPDYDPFGSNTNQNDGAIADRLVMLGGCDTIKNGHPAAAPS